MTNLDAILNLMISAHRERYATDASDLTPMVMTFRDNQIIRIHLVPDMMSPEGKQRAQQTLQAIVLADLAEGYILHSEAWAVRPKKGDKIDGIIPSQHADRYEILLVSAYSQTGTAFRALEILRNNHGAILKEDDLQGADMFSVFDIFKRGGTFH